MKTARKMRRTHSPVRKSPLRSSRTTPVSPESIPGPANQARTRIDLNIPAILLENDPQDLPTEGGPGAPFSLGPTSLEAGEAETTLQPTLPGTYGTQQLFLTPCDPHGLCAHWDFTQEQIRNCAARAPDRQLTLRLFQEAALGDPLLQVPLPLVAQHLFVPVEHAQTSYVADLGYYPSVGPWVTLALSAPARTPGDTVTAEADVKWATLPLDAPSGHLSTPDVPLNPDSCSATMPSEPTGQVIYPNPEPSSELFQEPVIDGTVAREAEQPKSPEESPPELSQPFGEMPEISWPTNPNVLLEWTTIIGHPAGLEAQLKPAETDLIAAPKFPPACTPDCDIVKTSPVPARGAPDEVRLMAASPKQAEAPGAGRQPKESVSSPTAPFAANAPQSAFWFNLNAELILYGATEPDAQVRIAGRSIKLRADGTFSLRLALPEGRFEICAEAISASGGDLRAAGLTFSRQTHCLGDVGTTAPGH